jgi:O-antigen ligase
VRRIGSLLEWGQLRESTRWLIWRTGLELWQEAPVWGIGFGQFRYESGLFMWRQPHNLFVEALCELGAVGFILVCGLVVPPLMLVLRGRSALLDPIRAGLAALFVFLFTCTMFSGAITDNRLLLTFAGALLAHDALHNDPRGARNGPAGASNCSQVRG